MVRASVSLSFARVAINWAMDNSFYLKFGEVIALHSLNLWKNFKAGSKKANSNLDLHFTVVKFSWLHH